MSSREGEPMLLDVPVLRRFPPVGPHPVLLARVIAFNLAKRGTNRVLRRTYGRRVAARTAGATLAPVPVDLPPFEQLPEELRDAAATVRAEADAICEHRVEFLGSGLVPLGDQIDWHTDFKSGYRWEPLFYMDVEVTRLDDDSDAKVPWELSRGHQLLTLARAARLFEEEAYALELEAQLRSWIDANPPGYGINWVNAMEVGLRAVNWLWAIGTLEEWRPLEPRLRERVLESLQAHGRHIAMNLEGSPFLRSNHYLSDLLGLLAVGAGVRGDRRAERSARFAHKGLEREIHEQVLPDGVGFEASLPYHGLALEIFLVALVLGERLGTPFSPRYLEQARRMLDVARQVRHPDGRHPIFGDNDSGRVLPEGFGRPPTHDHLLWLGAVLLGDPRPHPGPPHPEVAWTLGIDAWRRANELAEPAERGPSAAFPDGGLYVLRGGGSQLVVRCGDLGQRGNGGHAHNDLLSYELSRGEPLLVDSGNYAYTFDLAARNELRSTRAHNAVMVDGEEINPIPAHLAFKLAQVAWPTVESWEPAREPASLAVSHDGYRRLPDPVRHRRTFRLDRRTGAVEVVDELFGQGRHTVESFLHLSRHASAELEGQRASIALAGERIGIEVDGARADEPLSLADGWLSDSYGTRERGRVLVARYEGELPARLTVRIVPEAGE